MHLHGRHIEIRGVVQGVGFRPWVYQLAHHQRIRGSIRNDSRGVVIEAFGHEDDLASFTERLEREAPPAAVVREVLWVAAPYREVNDFTIAPSTASGVRRVVIPPDLATCDDCLREVFDPSDRRYLYPFTNCTNCGPRYTIVRGVPYDRDKTTMAGFTMCAECRAEYEDPLNRRFHAQPNACPKCGPQVTAANPEGRPIEASNPIRFAARAIGAQLIVAVKGLGGFHLACDATSSTAVQRLRERKRREGKPLAVMVASAEEAERLAVISPDERRLLESVERPIVLLKRRNDSRLAPSVCGENPLVGLFLPYTPLHHILLRECRRPLVMTSGNVSEEPMVTGNQEAIAQLGTVADIFLLHNREIESRADDSVARLIDGTTTLFRRARGYVPRAIEVGRSFHEPLLAVGAHLKNAICIGVDGAAFLGPHIGDLENLETLQSFETAIDRMKSFIGVDPKVVVHDLHPDYLSTRYALGLRDVRTIAVQHHHAHIASAMAEHGLDEPVVGVAYDGTGFGTDGTSWGGEILLADFAGFTRFATFRPIALAGGEQAIRQVWRIALALLDDAYDGEPPLHALPLFDSVPERAIAAVRKMAGAGVNVPPARGVGRYFDALGALGLARPLSSYEGEVAFLWNVVADGAEAGMYPFAVHPGLGVREIDLRPLVRAAVDDLIAGRPASFISAKFHNTLASVTIELAQEAASTIDGAPIVLSGGCFQNARLAQSIIDGLRPRARVYTNHQTPPGDGGLALGQALIGDAIARSGSAAGEFQKEVPACV